MAAYTQNWSAGNSLFTSVAVYRRSNQGIDPLYPDMDAAENVTVSGGRVLDAGRYGGDQGATGLIFHFDNTAISGSVGSVEVEYTPSAKVLSSTDANGLWYVPIIAMWGTRNGFSPIQSMWMALDPVGGKGQPYVWDLYVRNYNDSSHAEFFEGNVSFAADQPYVFKMCWKCGTPTGSPTTSVAADGWVKWYLDGVLIHEVLNFPVWVSQNANLHEWVSFASDVTHSGGGLFGSLGNISISETECGTPPTPPVQEVTVQNQANCCGTVPTPGAGGPSAGAMMEADPHTAPPIWVPFCTGGGLPPTAANPSHSEDWSA